MDPSHVNWMRKVLLSLDTHTQVLFNFLDFKLTSLFNCYVTFMYFSLFTVLFASHILKSMFPNAHRLTRLLCAQYKQYKCEVSSRQIGWQPLYIQWFIQ